jgi:hypothetical protein
VSRTISWLVCNRPAEVRMASNVDAGGSSQQDQGTSSSNHGGLPMVTAGLIVCRSNYIHHRWCVTKAILSACADFAAAD